MRGGLSGKAFSLTFSRKGVVMKAFRIHSPRAQSDKGEELMGSEDREETEKESGWNDGNLSYNLAEAKPSIYPVALPTLTHRWRLKMPEQFLWLLQPQDFFFLISFLKLMFSSCQCMGVCYGMHVDHMCTCMRVSICRLEVDSCVFLNILHLILETGLLLRLEMANSS